MNARRDKRTTTKDTAPPPAAPAIPVTNGNAKANNNDRWDADEEPWRHPPVAPRDESAAKSFGRAVSDAVVSAADDDPDAKAKPG